MRGAEATSIAPRRSQRNKKQVERFGSGAYPPSRLSHDGISSVRDLLVSTKKRKRAEEPDSDAPEPASCSDGQGVGEARRARKGHEAASTAETKTEAPLQKKMRIFATLPAKPGPKATMRTWKRNVTRWKQIRPDGESAENSDVGAYFNTVTPGLLSLSAANTERAGERWISLLRRLHSSEDGKKCIPFQQDIFLVQNSQFLSPVRKIRSMALLLLNLRVPMQLKGSLGFFKR